MDYSPDSDNAIDQDILRQATELLKKERIQEYWGLVAKHDPIVAELLEQHTDTGLLTDEILGKLARIDIAIRTNQIADDGPFQLSQADIDQALQSSGVPISKPNQEADPIDPENSTDDQVLLDEQDQNSISKMISAAGTPDKALDELLAKGPENWTEDELKSVMREKGYNNTAHPQSSAIRTSVAQWFDHHYGKDPVKQDFSGRTVMPDFVQQPHAEPQEAKDPMGFAINHGARNVARQVANLAQVSGLPNAVQHLQLGINGLNRFKALQANENGALTPQEKDLLLDGDFGPKTKTSLRNALRQYGAETVENALALAQIGSFAEYSKQSGDAEHLEAIAHLALDQLFDLQPGEVAQHNKLNQILQFVISNHGALATSPDDSSEKLLLDGIIGPKTKQAFVKALQNSDGFEFAKHLGEGLGLQA